MIIAHGNLILSAIANGMKQVVEPNPLVQMPFMNNLHCTL